MLYYNCFAYLCDIICVPRFIYVQFFKSNNLFNKKCKFRFKQIILIIAYVYIYCRKYLFSVRVWVLCPFSYSIVDIYRHFLIISRISSVFRKVLYRHTFIIFSALGFLFLNYSIVVNFCFYLQSILHLSEAIIAHVDTYCSNYVFFWLKIRLYY